MGSTRLIPAWPARFTALSRVFQFGEAAGPNLEGPARVTVAPFCTGRPRGWPAMKRAPARLVRVVAPDPTHVVRRNQGAGCAAPRTHAIFKVADGVVSSRTLVIDTDGVRRKAQGPSTSAPSHEAQYRWRTQKAPPPERLGAKHDPPRRPPRLGVDASAVATQGGLTGALARSSIRSRPFWASSILPGRGRRLPRPDRQNPLDPPRPPALRSCSASVWRVSAPANP